MPTKPWKDLEGHYFRIDVGSTAADAMRGDPYTIYYTTDGYIVLNGEMMGRTITDDCSPMQVIDLSALDPNTWYPVTCILPEYLPTNVLTIHHYLQGWDGPIPPWATHRLGFFAFMRVVCNPSDWDANRGYVVITHNRCDFIGDKVYPVRYKCMSHTRYTERSHSVAIFYLRGGTSYHGSIQIGNDIEIEKQYLAPWAVHPDGFTDKGANVTYLPISDTSKLPANIPDVPDRLDNLESTVKTKANSSSVYDRATVDQKLTDKADELSNSIGHQAKRIDKVQDVGIVAFTDLEASVTSVQQSSVSMNFAICYAEMQNVFVAKTLVNGQPKYYNNWPTAEMYNKDGVARADKLYMRFTNGTMVPYAYHPGMRKLVAIPAGVTSGTDSLENCIKKLENKHLALRKKIKKPYLMVGRRIPYGAFPGSAYYVKHPYPFKIFAYDITSKLTFSEPVNLYNEQTRGLITATEVTLADVQNGYDRFVPVSMATQIDGVNPVIIVCNKQQMSPDHWDLSNYTITFPGTIVNLNQYHQPCQTSRLIYCEDNGGSFELRLLPPRPLTLEEARQIADGKIYCITQYYRRCAGMDGRHSVLYRPRGIVSNTKVLKKVSGMCTSRTFVVYRRVHHGSRLVIAGRFRVLNGKSVVLI